MNPLFPPQRAIVGGATLYSGFDQGALRQGRDYQRERFMEDPPSYESVVNPSAGSLFTRTGLGR